jgi:uncharacterized NAD(P)/FAD-binding protein YdhS
MSHRVLILGGGASGALVAIRLLRAAHPPDVVCVIERESRLARGIAYSTPHREHLLNVPAARMSVFAEDPDHFRRWLAAEGLEADAQSYAARSDYGRYVAGVLEESARLADGRTRLVHVRGDAIELEPQPDRVRVRMANGQVLEGDRAVLALGHERPRFPPVLSEQLPGMIEDPWSPGALESLAPDSSVAILGSGLTMVDVALRLRSRGHRAAIHAISRHGLLPRPQRSRRNDWPLTVPLRQGCSRAAAVGIQPHDRMLRPLLRYIRSEIERASKAGSGWEDVFDSLRPLAGELWMQLSHRDRHAFLRHLRSYWDVHRHRMAPRVAAEVAALIEAGSLRVHAGRIRNVRRANAGLTIEFARRGESALRTLQVDALVNASGHTGGPHPLVSRLFAAGHARPGPYGLGVDATTDRHVVDASGRAQPRITAIGPLLRGVLWETTAIPDIREQARAEAER